MRILDDTVPGYLSLCKQSKISVDSFQKYYLQQNPAIWLDKRNNWLNSTKSGLRCYFPLMIISMKKIEDINIFPTEMLLIKESWLDKRTNWPHPAKSGTLRYYFSLMIISIKKIYDTNRFLPEILSIKEHCNMIRREAQLVTPNQKRKSEMLSFLDV